MKMSRKISRFANVFLALLLLCGLLAGCGGGGGSTSTSGGSTGGSAPASTTTGSSTASAGPSVYFLNANADKDAQWQALAKAYTEETKVDVKVVSPAAAQYDSTLKTELAKTSGAPTLFQVNGPMGVVSYGDKAYDLTGSQVYGELTSDYFALKDGSAVSGIAYMIDSFGLIFNKDLLKTAGYEQDDVMNFFRLREAVNDITARKEELGFVAFATTGMDPSSSQRITRMITNLAIFHEYDFDKKLTSHEIKCTYHDQWKNVLDMYTNNNSTVPRKELSTKTMADSIGEFTSEKAVFMLNKASVYDQIKSLGDDKLGMMPMLSSAYAEDRFGLCTGSDSFWMVNKGASADSIKATLDFMYWCVTSDAGVEALCKDMGYQIPYKKNTTSNVLTKIADAYIADGKIPMSWAYTTMPSKDWEDLLGSTVLEYFAGTKTNTDMQNVFRKAWAAEYAKVYGAP